MKGAYLEITLAGKSARVPAEQSVITIGRGPDNGVVLGDDMASRKHAVIERTSDGWRVRDLGSSNGTRVNGQIVKISPLRPGDAIQIGRTTITLFDPSLQEQLTADDVVDDGLEDLAALASGRLDEDPPPAGIQLDENVDYETALFDLAESLPQRMFEEGEIALINSRGQVVHEATREVKQIGQRDAVDLFRLLLIVCFRSRTTDIHLEPRQDFYSCRLRIDGNMVDVARLPNQVGHRLATLVKVLSDIDIQFRDSIQEGHFAARVPDNRFKGGSRRVDYRVSFAPGVYGQKLVIRVLDTANAPLKMSDLHMPAWMLQEIARGIESESGMVLVSGPTGSGKTTTLYSLVRSIDTGRRNVITIEDPVEIQIDGITQIPVDEESGKTFSALLRMTLRQDPDVILVGEIRDAETARIAMQASITGHLVFSTVHTKDAIGSIFRLLDLGVEPYLVAQGLHLVVAQRLVRQLCPHCKRPEALTAEQAKVLGPAAEGVTRLYQPRGCPRCLGTGFLGRRAFFELLRVTDRLRDTILRQPTMQEISAAVADSDTRFVRLQQAGFELVAQGLVSFAEMDRIVGRG
ncbi:MAG: ATPase, T2SS/T4P/T4SS family [Phycisphaerae bacterium]|nr:ATPase, T2SS/T4P/T4SS family [Phycisphaerae bacterium]MDW8261072.1 ATPase, T2SS/T4P/T4SS family [Phycisphaerales bacterium]